MGEGESGGVGPRVDVLEGRERDHADVIHGRDVDWNVPILGGEQMYQSMKSLGKETELVVYPGEYHEFKTPTHLKDRMERYLAWYAHYVKADGTPARPPEKASH